MNRARRIALATAAVWASVATASPAAGQVAFASAERLRTWCLAGGAPRASCNGYLMGVTDSLRHPAVAAALASGGAAVCLPPRLHGEQVRNLFLNHLHRHPERGAHAASDAIWSTLLEAFRCPESPAPAPGERSEGDRISEAGERAVHRG